MTSELMASLLKSDSGGRIFCYHRFFNMGKIILSMCVLYFAIPCLAKYIRQFKTTST